MGGFLTVGCCFPYCSLEIFMGGQGCDAEGQSRDREDLLWCLNSILL